MGVEASGRRATCSGDTRRGSGRLCVFEPFLINDVMGLSSCYTAVLEMSPGEKLFYKGQGEHETDRLQSRSDHRRSGDRWFTYPSRLSSLPACHHVSFSSNPACHHVWFSS